MSPLRKITLAALTYNRPQGLAALIAGIAAIKCPDGVTLSVVIVDNSPDQTAKAMIEAAKTPFSLTYLHCAEKGLTPARNTALAAALGAKADAIGFIDDDEVPGPDWLIAHLAALTAADVSVGRVRATYQDPPANWIRRGGFHEIGGFARHQPMSFGYTSNVLMRLAPVRKLSLRFDDRFSLTGGEDTHFFQCLLRAGCRIVFAPDAVVVESIVPSRAQIGWLWRRWRRTGQTNASIRLIWNGPHDRAVCLAGGVLRLGIGLTAATIALPAWTVGRFDIPARALRIAARGLGFIDGAVGHQTEEYRVVTR